MSRIVNAPVEIPSGVEVSLNADQVLVKGKKGELAHSIHPAVKITQHDNTLQAGIFRDTKESVALAGTTRALLNNMVLGVSQGFTKKLTLTGVGYRAKAQGNTLELTLGYSHPVQHVAPEGIDIETPSQTDIVVSGADKQLVGQVAADIRAYRPPEPYKGKGIRYENEYIALKDAKKK